MANVLQREFRGGKASYHAQPAPDTDDCGRQHAVNRLLRKARESGLDTDYVRNWVPALVAAPMFPTFSPDFLVLAISLRRQSFSLADLNGPQLESLLVQRFVDAFAGRAADAPGDAAGDAPGDAGGDAGGDAAGDADAEERGAGAEGGASAAAAAADRAAILLRAKAELVRYMRLLNFIAQGKYPPDQ